MRKANKKAVADSSAGASCSPTARRLVGLIPAVSPTAPAEMLRAVLAVEEGVVARV